MKPQLAVDRVDMESVFTDACRQRRENLDALHGLATQAHEILFQKIRLDRGDHENNPTLKGLRIVSEVLGSLSDSMSRFQANRALFYKDLGFSLPVAELSRIMEFKKLTTWLNSVPDEAYISENVKALSRILRSIDHTLTTIKGSGLSAQLAEQFGGLTTQLYYIESELKEYCLSLLANKAE